MGFPQEIGHIVLNVSDVEKSLEFYRDVIGFEVSSYRPGRSAFLTCGVIHHNLALFQASEDAQPWRKGQIGLSHFAFKVTNYPSLQAAHQRLVEAEATIDHVTNHGVTRSVYFQDPDGITMELFADAFPTNAEGLAYMKAGSEGREGRGGGALDITAPEPPQPVIRQAEATPVH